MKLAFVSNDSEKSQGIKDYFQTLCHMGRFEGDDTDPDVVISIGGDGTLLSAFHQYQDRINHVKFAAIHTGHLGFYTDWVAGEAEQLAQSLINDDLVNVSYPLLQLKVIQGERSNRRVRQILCLNEATIKQVTATFICEVFIGDELFETFRGDGLCVSTPTGSTGINKSIGGAVVHPSLNALQLTEFASLNNRVFRTLSSPLIVTQDETITFRPISNGHSTEKLVLTYDNLFESAEELKELSFKVADERIHFLGSKHKRFWNRVSYSFIGPVKGSGHEI